VVKAKVREPKKDEAQRGKDESNKSERGKKERESGSKANVKWEGEGGEGGEEGEGGAGVLSLAELVALAIISKVDASVRLPRDLQLRVVATALRLQRTCDTMPWRGVHGIYMRQTQT
jgi:hypothetical protein